MFLYDRKTDLKEFSLLDDEIARDMNRRITLWLQKNVGLDDVLHLLTPGELGAEEVP
jgi:hypothetical protein